MGTTMQAPVVAGRRLGFRPSREKSVDEVQDQSFRATSFASTRSLPSSASVMSSLGTALDQGRLGTCAENAAFKAIWLDHVQQYVASGMALLDAQKRARLGSRLFGYYFARAYDAVTDVDAGTTPRNLFRSLNKFGFTFEDGKLEDGAWPYSDSLGPSSAFGSVSGPPFTLQPSREAIELAFDQKSPLAYHRIDSQGAQRVDDCKKAIASGKAICIGSNVSYAMTSLAFDPTVPMDPPVGKPIAGGHMWLLGAYKGDDFESLNSWGEDDHTRFMISADYVTWRSTSDLWIVSHAPRFD